MNRWPAYPAYKDAGVAWLREIPAHWTVKKLKYVLGLGSGESPPEKRNKNQGENPIYGANGIIGYCNSRNLRDRALIIGRVGSSGEINIAPPNSWVSDNALIVRLDDSNIDFRYAYYLLDTTDFGKWASRNAQPLITATLVRNWFFGSPPLPEQRAIAAFLDRETAKLDALTRTCEQLLDRLEERRAALISHAVTKGLDPDAGMKDSGVPWLGEIPAHWEVVQVRHISESLQTGPFGSQLHSSEYIKDGTPVINPSHMEEGYIVPDWEVTVDKEALKRLERHKLVAGDIIFARRGDLGRCALVMSKEEGWLCGTGSLRMHPRSEMVHSPFLNRVFSTRGIAEWLALQSVGSTMDNLNTSILARLPIPVPPLPEQQAIAAHLDRETAKLDALTAKVRAAIERLDEYRTALIAAAVTGKIDVRNEVGRTSEVRPTWGRPT